MKKRVLIPSGFLVLLLTAGLALIFIRCQNRSSGPSGLVTGYYHLYSSPMKEKLTSLLDEFSSFYPEVTMTNIIEPYQDMRRILYRDIESGVNDRVIIAVMTGQDLDRFPRKGSTDSPWISYSWKLYYNRDRLKEMGYGKEDLLELSRRGLDAFSEELSAKLNEEETLYSLGSSFYWPWLAWIQHLQLLENRGSEPEGFSPDAWSDGIGKWKELLARGYFNSDFRIQNQASSQLAVSHGSSCFVLSDSGIFSTYLPGERGSLDSIPFPGSEEQGWVIGSNFYLNIIIPEGAPKATVEAGNLLMDYLRSEGVSSRYLQQTGIRFLPFNEKTLIQEIPSITHRTMETEVQDLLKFLD